MKRMPLILFIILCFTALLHIFLTVEHRYFYFLQLQFSSYDLGLHIQGIWKMSFWNDSFNTLRGSNYLGDHLWLINYLLIPIFKIFPSVITLFALQSMALAGSALVFYKISEHITKNSIYSFVLGIAWLIHPALFNMNMESYHPETIATFFLSSAILCFLKNKISWMYALLFIACLGKEDIALTVLTFCGFLFVIKREKHYLYASIAFFVFFIVSLKFIIPSYNEVGFFRHEDGYWFAKLARSWWKLDFYKNIFINDYIGIYVIGLLGPVALLCLRSPIYLIPMLPSFFINILSGVKYLSSVEYHYNNQTLPYDFWAAAVGFTKLENKKWQALFIVLTVIWSLAMSQSLNHWKIPVMASHVWSRIQNPYYGEKRKSFEKIYNDYLSSPEIVISASHNLTPSLSFRPFIYAYPNPYIKSNYGLSPYAAYKPPMKAELVLIDTEMDDPEKAEKLLKKDAFIIYHDDFFLLYKIR